MKLLPYLKMHGNARAAINRYKQIFNGTIERLQEYKDSPIANQNNQNLVIHSELHFKGNIICFADMISKEESDQIKNQTIQQLYELCINFDENQYDNALKVFNSLSENGKVLMKFQKTFWQAYYGKVKDQFGVLWSLNCPLKESQIEKQKLKSPLKSSAKKSQHNSEKQQNEQK